LVFIAYAFSIPERRQKEKSKKRPAADKQTGQLLYIRNRFCPLYFLEKRIRSKKVKIRLTGITDNA
jgi:hypothetical protein